MRLVESESSQAPSAISVFDCMGASLRFEVRASVSAAALAAEAVEGGGGAAGAVPVLVDIDPVSFNLDPRCVEAAITSRTAAIMPVHIFGQCAEMEPLWKLASAFDLPIIEDSAQAIGAEYRGERTGALGKIGCFSFFPTKNLFALGDGGLIGA